MSRLDVRQERNNPKNNTKGKMSKEVGSFMLHVSVNYENLCLIINQGILLLSTREMSSLKKNSFNLYSFRFYDEAFTVRIPGTGIESENGIWSGSDHFGL